MLPDIGQYDAPKREIWQEKDGVAAFKQVKEPQCIRDHHQLRVLHQKEHHGGDCPRDDERQRHDPAENRDSWIVLVKKEGNGHAERKLDEAAEVLVEQRDTQCSLDATV